VSFAQYVVEVLQDPQPGFAALLRCIGRTETTMRQSNPRTRFCVRYFKSDKRIDIQWSIRERTLIQAQRFIHGRQCSISFR
jgi:hypothetical protein